MPARFASGELWGNLMSDCPLGVRTPLSASTVRTGQNLPAPGGTTTDRPASNAPRARHDSGIVLRISDEARRALQHLSRLLVGQMSLKDAQRALRTSMSQEALERCGSRRAAATMLGIDRRYVQRLAHESDLCDSDYPADEAGPAQQEPTP